MVEQPSTDESSLFQALHSEWFLHTAGFLFRYLYRTRWLAAIAVYIPHIIRPRMPISRRIPRDLPPSKIKTSIVEPSRARKKLGSNGRGRGNFGWKWRSSTDKGKKRETRDWLLAWRSRLVLPFSVLVMKCDEYYVIHMKNWCFRLNLFLNIIWLRFIWIYCVIKLKKWGDFETSWTNYL